ncbi:MAG: hypothetical protein RJA07_1835 [Bacteroidota bacterium]|jgi:uncharacterized protein (DUF2147 family)
MKKIIATIFISVFINILFAQPLSADLILGRWINTNKDLIVECFKQGDKYFAKIVWFHVYPNDPNDMVEIPESTWLNTVVMKDFVFDTNEWNSGTIKNLRNGKTYTAYIQMGCDNSLIVTGYVGFRFLSSTIIFTKYTNAKLPETNK